MRFNLTLLLVVVLALAPRQAPAQLMLVGNDEKVTWDDAGKPVFLPPGKDTVSIVDISSREAPRILVTLPLLNSVFGPPTNLQITPDGTLALVANSMAWTQDGGAWKPTPDTKLYVIDLTTSPPAHIATVEVGKQPSGLAINHAGDLALVTNRADNSISVLSIHGKEVKLIDSVAIGEMVAAVAIAPDGRRAFEVNGQKVTYSKYDMPAGLWPYNIDITPNGTLALTADNGNGGASDGHVDTVSVIDLEANPPRVIDRVVVGDAPEGLAISPTGEIAVAILLNGSAGVAKNAWFAHRAGKVVVLKIDGKRVTKVQEVEVGGLPEGVVFSPDGKYLYVGNYTDRDVSILKVDRTTVTDTGKRFKLPGQPASMRGAAHGRRLPRELETLPRVRDRRPVHLEDGDVAVGVVAHVEVLAVRAKDDALRQAAHLDLLDLRDPLAVDLQHDDLARAVCEPGVLRHAGAAVEQDGDRDLAGRADREALGRVTDHDAVDDARRVRLEVDDSHRVHVAVGGTTVAVVGGEGQRAVRRDVDVVRPEPCGHVVLRVGVLLAVDLAHRDLVTGELDRERTPAIGRDRDGRDHLADRHRVDQLHLFAMDREHADRVVGAVRDQRQVARVVDGEARG